MPWTRWCGLSILVLAALGPLSLELRAQSISEAAAKEKERRRVIGRAAPTITDQDLSGRRPSSGSAVVPPSVSTVAASRVTAAEPAEEPERLSEEEERQDRLEAWRQMLEITRDEVKQFTADIERLQASVSGVSGLYGSARAERIGQLEKAKQDLATSRRVLEELEDTGRRRGYR
ncbi:MAG TPA: hypothetical protein VKA01_07610 [Vicinamibacteria bacterium]|nr:hypothetical protein [Vicinamibacteria bacterium]